MIRSKVCDRLKSLDDNILTFYEISFQTFMHYKFMLFSFLYCFLHGVYLDKPWKSHLNLRGRKKQWRLDLLIMKTNLLYKKR